MITPPDGRGLLLSLAKHELDVIKLDEISQLDPNSLKGLSDFGFVYVDKGGVRIHQFVRWLVGIKVRQIRQETVNH
jgi:hypothetical protein